MGRLNESGLSLVETLLAVALLAMLAVGVIPAFSVMVATNTRNEVRTAAVSAVQQTLEAYRLIPPDTMLDTGSDPPQVVTIGNREFTVLTTFCSKAEFCGAGSRHLTVAASHEGRKIYHAETVYTTFE